jgi:DDE superfamily endonuclease
VAYRLYLPKDWASDRERRRKVGVPDEIGFKTKPVALAQIRWALRPASMSLIEVCLRYIVESRQPCSQRR